MAAVEISSPGGPEVLKVTERPVPRPGHGEILIKVEAAGVNRPDLLQRAGAYPPPPGASDLPGLEVAGQVVSVGPGVAPSMVGEDVCALTPGGGYAHYCLTPAPQALPYPKGFDAVKAAALPETFFTVWTNMFDRACLSAGESLLVHGGSSGIGTVAIQLGVAFGARVFATAGNDAKCEACLSLGAERAINYREEDFVEVVKAATDGRGVDVILDMVAGPYVQRNLNALAESGRLSIIAVMGGMSAEIDIFGLMRNRHTITGSTLRPRTITEKAAIARSLQSKVWPLLENNRVKPLIHKVFPLDQAGEAHALMEAGDHIGKIVLTA